MARAVTSQGCWLGHRGIKVEANNGQKSVVHPCASDGSGAIGELVARPGKRTGRVVHVDWVERRAGGRRHIHSRNEQPTEGVAATPDGRRVNPASCSSVEHH